MTTYRFFIPIPESDPKDIIGLLAHIDEYKGNLQILDGVQVATADPDTATALQALFGVNAEIDCQDMAAFDDAWRQIAPDPQDFETEEAYRAAAAAEMPDESPTLPEPVATAEPPDKAMRNCEYCGKPYRPRRKDQRFDSKECLVKFGARKRKVQKNGNGREPKTETEGDPAAPRHQSKRWYIPHFDGGPALEADNINELIDRGSLTPGQQAYKLNKGWYEVFEATPGVLALRKVKEAQG